MFALIALRNTVTSSIEGFEDRYVPQVPQSWGIILQSGDWVTLYPNGISPNEPFLHAKLMVLSGSVGAWVVAGESTVLRALRDSSVRTWSLRELREDDRAVATAIKEAWRDERASGSLDSRVGLYSTMAGFDLPGVLLSVSRSVDV